MPYSAIRSRVARAWNDMLDTLFEWLLCDTGETMLEDDNLPGLDLTKPPGQMQADPPAPHDVEVDIADGWELESADGSMP